MSEIKRFTLDANIDGMDQMREFVLASDYEARVHDLETMCDPAGLTAENALLCDQTRMLDAMIGRLKTEAQDAMDTLVAVLNAIGYTEEVAAANPELKVSEGVRLFLSDPTQGVDESLNCDFCGVSVDDPWHASDATHKHLHKCDACHAIAPTQGADARPVAWATKLPSGNLSSVRPSLKGAEKRTAAWNERFPNPPHAVTVALCECATRDTAPSDAPTDEQAMFESWCVSNGWLRINLERNPAAGYADADIDDMWDGWNARANIAASAPREEA